MKLILFAFFIATFNCFANDLEIYVDGKTFKTIKEEEIKKLETKNLTHINHGLKENELYFGPTILTLIEKYVPHLKNQIKELEFTTTNGYKSYFLEDKFHKVDAILAYARADQKKFVRISRDENKIIDLGPYYLIWDSIHTPKDSEYDYKSVFKVHQIGFNTSTLNFHSFKDEVSESAFLGYRSYHNFCLSCHAIGNRGGSLSYNLLKRDIFSEKKRKWLMDYILNPKSVRKDSLMPALPEFKNRQKMAQGIIEYLEFAKDPIAGLQKNKIDPKSLFGQSFLKEIRKAIDFEFNNSDNNSNERKKYGDLLNAIDQHLIKK